MSRKIKVDPAELESAASLMEAQVEEYKSLYNSLFSEVDGMVAHWQGADNVAFTNQIKGFMDDFNKMEEALKEYATFLRKASDTYTQVQTDRVSAAQTLTN